MKIEWISVTERLPENDTICLVCGKKGGMRVARIFVPKEVGDWTGDPNENWWTVVGSSKCFNAVAWMPLPEPYREEGEQR